MEFFLELLDFLPYPFGIAGLLIGGVLGYYFDREVGLIIGSSVGVLFGLWLDDRKTTTKAKAAVWLAIVGAIALAYVILSRS